MGKGVEEKSRERDKETKGGKGGGEEEGGERRNVEGGGGTSCLSSGCRVLP